MVHTAIKTELDAQLQAVLFHGRERRLSLAGVPEMFRTHLIRGATDFPVLIATGTSFPSADRIRPITWKTAVRMTADGTVATQHRGLCFEVGGSTNGSVLWVDDDRIGFRAGAAELSGDEAVAVFDNGTELVAGLELDIVVAAIPGDGRIRMWLNGKEAARATATNGTFNTEWSGSGSGTFASIVIGVLPTDVPTTSAIAPDGFELIEPLSAYVGQVPRHFV